MKNGKDKLERAIVRWALLRLKRWKKDYPRGLIPYGKPGCITTKSGYNLVRDCLKLEKLLGR